MGGLIPSEALPEEAPVEEREAEPVRFLRDVEGELTIDASDPFTAFPTPVEMLSFSSWEEYAEFLEEMFNVVRHIGPGGETVALAASWTMIGEPWALSPDMTDIVPVTDPIATFVGGISGFVEIGGEKHCVNSDRCENAINPLGLGPVQSLEYSESSLNSEAEHEDTPALAVAAPPFSIRAGITHALSYVQDWWTNPLGHVLDFTATTIQGEGGYNRWVGHILRDPVMICGAEAGLPEYLCVYYPPMFYLARGRNFLSATMTSTGPKWVSGQCSTHRVISNASGADVPRVTARQSFFVRGFPLRIGFTPTNVRGNHLGLDRDYGTVDLKNTYLPVYYPPEC